ncbi:MAG: trypsin-like peptidase domain-containing protein [Flavisolibacter sp.]|nr:trypsin-like peptidase domain-containing protein [Flavisolibacter sp.]
MKKRRFLPMAILGAALMAGSFYFGYSQKEKDTLFLQPSPVTNTVNAVQTAYTGTETPPTDFERAAESAVPSVVHIQTVTKAKQVAGRGGQNPFDDDIMRYFFGDGNRPFVQPEQRASGSGVIISKDGYIVTNNHVVNGATEVTVRLSSGTKAYKAKVIGNDPSTDLALIKIDANNLPVMPIGNSDNVRLGQSVLAVGYPLNLDVTVTQGIVSAKSRSIGINGRGSNAPVESFIQTDAAVNPGSSGGALVNTNGELIGINSAIASPTGAYAGYAYAIPSNLMKKVIGDIMKYGTVQRGYLGISYAPADLDDAKKKELGIDDDVIGVSVLEVDPKGAAGEAGIKKGDVIVGIDGVATPAAPQMVEQIARHKPGDVVNVMIQRGSTQRTVPVTLKNKSGSFASLAPAAIESLGVALSDVSAEDAAKMGISGGVQVTDIQENGIIADQTNMKPGFVITKVAGKTVRNVNELKSVLSGVSGNFGIEGIYPGDSEVYYYGINGFRK